MTRSGPVQRKPGVEAAGPGLHVDPLPDEAVREASTSIGVRSKRIHGARLHPPRSAPDRRLGRAANLDAGRDFEFATRPTRIEPAAGCAGGRRFAPGSRRRAGGHRFTHSSATGRCFKPDTHGRAQPAPARGGGATTASPRGAVTHREHGSGSGDLDARLCCSAARQRSGAGDPGCAVRPRRGQLHRAGGNVGQAGESGRTERSSPARD